MNAADDRAAAHAQRLRARRALAEADAAVTRLNEARARAKALLRRAAGEGAENGDERPSEDTLRRRMRQIENRMQKTDARMRLAELDANRAETAFLDERIRDEQSPEDVAGRDAAPGRGDRGEDAWRDDARGARSGDVGTRRPPPSRRR